MRTLAGNSGSRAGCPYVSESCKTPLRDGRGSDRRAGRPYHPLGFTLIEMIVALAIMVVVLAVVSNVFSLTANTARTATAISDVENATRDLFIDLEQDFDGIDPTESILVLVGGTQVASRTQAELEAGLMWQVLVGDPRNVRSTFDPRFNTNPEYSPPRNDIMMFITKRPGTSAAPAPQPNSNDEFQKALTSGAPISPQLVVYGHAALAQAYKTGGGTYDWPGPGEWTSIVPRSGRSDDLSAIPVTRWHLARRATLLGAPPNGATTNWASVQTFVKELAKLGAVSANGQFAGDGMDYLNLRELLDDFSVDPLQPLRASMPLASPYEFSENGPNAGQTNVQWSNNARDAIRYLLFGNRTLGSPEVRNRHIATVIENTPPDLASNTAVQLLPGCAWFQVEFLMPEDPRNSRVHPDAAQRDDMPRWVEIEPGQTYVFVADRPENRDIVYSQWLDKPSNKGGNEPPPPGSRARMFANLIPPGAAPSGGGAAGIPFGSKGTNRVIRLWPYAVRVTVRVFDRDGRMESPIVRSFVHRFD